MLFQHEPSLLLFLSCHWRRFTQQAMNFYGNLITFQLEVQANKQQQRPWPGWQRCNIWHLLTAAWTGFMIKVIPAEFTHLTWWAESMTEFILSLFPAWATNSRVMSILKTDGKIFMGKMPWWGKETNTQCIPAKTSSALWSTFNVFQLNSYLKLFGITSPT